MISLIEDLKELHTEILRRLVRGEKAPGIAEALSCSTALVYKTRNSPAGQAFIRGLQGEIRATQVAVQAGIDSPEAILRSNGNKAANVIVDLLDSPNEGIAQRSGIDILDRIGPSRKQENRNINLTIPISAIKTLEQAIEETGGLNG